MADKRSVRYTSVTVLRRGASFVALLAVIAAPAVTTTRFFCRYTGEEIIGCSEAASERDALVRADECCDRSTLHALDGVRLVKEERQQAPTTVAMDASRVLPANGFAAAPSARPVPTAPSVGPPAFLSHRALLI